MMVNWDNDALTISVDGNTTRYIRANLLDCPHEKPQVTIRSEGSYYYIETSLLDGPLEKIVVRLFKSTPGPASSIYYEYVREDKP